MAGPPSPGGEGPTYAPPPLPAGWIAQWDAQSKKYYFVQLSTGTSQWEVPTEPAPVGGIDDPANPANGMPQAPAEIIVHPDGSQTARYPDGRLEPVNPREDGTTGPVPAGTRGVGHDGSSDRGLGSLIGGALNTFGNKQGKSGVGLAGQVLGSLAGGGHSSSSHGSSGGGLGLAGQVLGTLAGGSHSSGHSSGSGGLGGKLAGQLASNLFGKSSSSHGSGSGASNLLGGHGSANLVTGLVGAAASGLFGGGSSKHRDNPFGYTNNPTPGGYTGTAPPPQYQPPSQPGTPNIVPSYQGGQPTTSQPHSAYGQSPAGQQYPPSYSAPPQHGQPYGQQNYGQSPPVPAPYPTSTSYGAASSYYNSAPASGYPPQSQYGQGYGQYH